MIARRDVIKKMAGASVGVAIAGAGFPAPKGSYATNAAPHLTENQRGAPWIKLYEETWHLRPGDYAITAYDAALVVTSAVASLAKEGKAVTRAAVLDAIQHSKTETLQGPVQFDRYGDILDHTVSIYRVVENKHYPLTDMLHQFEYIGASPPG